MPLNVRTGLAFVLLTASALVPSSAASAADAQQQFQIAVTVIEDYREDVFAQQVEVIDSPRLAMPVTYQSTIDALLRMRDMQVQPCFAEWWAHEYISLKLAALYALYMQEDSAGQDKVDHTGWLADRLHHDAQRMLKIAYEDCAPPTSAG